MLKEVMEEKVMRVRAGNKLRKLLGGVLTLSLLLSGLYLSPVQAAETGGTSLPTERSVSGSDPGGSNLLGTTPTVVPGEMASFGAAAPKETASGTYVLDTTADLTAFAVGVKADGDTQQAGTEDYFTLIYSAKTKVDASNKAFDDGYNGSQRVNFGGVVSVSKNAIKFTTSGAATIKIWWAQGGDDNRQIAILDGSGAQVAVTAETLAKNAACVSTLEVSEAGTYYLGSAINNNYIFKVTVEEEQAPVEITSVLDTTADLTAFAVGVKVDGDTQQAGTEDYFTLIYSAKTKVDASNKSFDDGYTGSQRVNFGGVVSPSKNAIKFTTSGPATVKVWWAQGGDDNRQIAILNAAGTQVTATAETLAKNAACISTLELSEAGTYYLGSIINNNYIFKVQVTETSGGSVKPPRAEWSTVPVPVINTVALNPDSTGKVDVTVSALVGYDGADKVTVTMLDAQGNVVETRPSSREASSHTLTFTPAATGIYTFKAVLSRKDETDKESATKTFSFTLPLAAPVMKSVTSSGNGTATVKWNAAPEADSYIVSATPVGDTTVAATVTTSELQAVLTGLTVGQRYTFSVVAVRGSEKSKASSMEAEITQEAQREWTFAAYGTGVDTKNNGHTGNINEGSVTVFGEGGKGKIQPASHDGLAFYYTEIDPDTENFTLTADISVDRWKFSNGQEGFGMMVTDSVGAHGDNSNFFTNSLQVLASKIEYTYEDGSKISMKLGLGYNARLGATAQDIADLKAGTIAIPVNFEAESGTLETSAGPLGSGTYNLVGNFTDTAPTGCLDNMLTSFRLQIQRNNTGYILRYLNADGSVIGEKLFYDLDRNALTQIDGDHIYVGFFAARNARVTVSNMTMTTIAPEDDAPAENREIEYIQPNYTIESASIANDSNHKLVYYGNADGTLTIQDAAGNVVVNAQHVLANTKNPFQVTLSEGTNSFTVTFTPDADYKPGEYKLLNSYETVTFTHSVEFKGFNTEQKLYVSPEGTPEGDGSKGSPLDIYTAVQYVKPGQYIMLAGGTYNLNRTVKVERGIRGTADNMIYMIADPETEGRPVFDFGGNCAGMILAGDYWYFQGFDVTRSADAQKGIQVSGSHNVLELINTYKNGNTGLQISRYKGTDEFEDWPSYNLILNCTSYLNADRGYEDADGFAAKLTVGEGNVFDGCISAYNADDGWDLFAKVQTGSIGSVTIQNCVAFKNGYVLRADGGAGDLDLNGAEVNAGNGNGFKMGGDSMSGYHVLINSVAFDNKAKGIDSNSCPDIQVYRSTSFDNESYNVAFYTNAAVNTDFLGDGILSYKVTNSVPLNYKPKGSQDSSKVLNDTNYFFDGTKSQNASGAEASLDWFVRTDIENAMFLLGEGGRNADGSINMQGLLALTDAAPAGVGARLNGNSGSSSVKKPDQYTSVVTDGIPEGSVPAEILAKVGCSDAKGLQEFLGKDIVASADANQILGASPAGTAVYEVEVKISLDGGKTWTAATEQNFPAKGVDVLLPYPKDTNAKDYDFVVSHLVVLGCNGKEPGTLEYLRPRKTNSGLLVHVMSASPFTVGWTEKQQSDDGNDNNGSNDSGYDNVVETGDDKTGASGKSKSPKTGDSGRGIYDATFLEKVVVKANDVELPHVEAARNVDDQENPSGADVLAAVTALAPVAGLVQPVGDNRIIGWLLAAMAILLTAGTAGVVFWERRKSEQEN